MLIDLLLKVLVNGLAVYVSAYILPGVEVESFVTAIVAGVVLGVVNAFLKPLLVVLTLPVNIMTLGLFTLIINALLVLLAAYIVEGFNVDGFLFGLLFSIVLSLVNSFLHSLVK